MFLKQMTVKILVYTVEVRLSLFFRLEEEKVIIKIKMKIIKMINLFPVAGVNLMVTHVSNTFNA